MEIYLAGLKQKVRDSMERLTERIDNVPDGESGVWVKQHDYISAAEKLADYEDAEEQGLLLLLPCKIGDMVYCFHLFPSSFECNNNYDLFKGGNKNEKFMQRRNWKSGPCLSR